MRVCWFSNNNNSNVKIRAVPELLKFIGQSMNQFISFHRKQIKVNVLRSTLTEYIFSTLSFNELKRLSKAYPRIHYFCIYKVPKVMCVQYILPDITSIYHILNIFNLVSAFESTLTYHIMDIYDRNVQEKLRELGERKKKIQKASHLICR